jgi:hypothetical protein
LGVGQKSLIDSQRLQVRERPSNVAGNDAEKRLGGGREKADFEAGVEKDRRNIAAVQNVFQIVRCRTLSLQCFLKLGINFTASK